MDDEVFVFFFSLIIPGDHEQEERMRNKIGMFLAIGLMTTVIALYPLPCEGQSLPKLDCQKMVLDYVKAFENLDYRTIFRLKGQPYSKEVESEVKLSESSSL